MLEKAALECMLGDLTCLQQKNKIFPKMLSPFKRNGLSLSYINEITTHIYHLSSYFFLFTLLFI